MNSNSFQPNKSTQAEESLPIAMNARRQSIVVRAPTVKVYERWIFRPNNVGQQFVERCTSWKKYLRAAKAKRLRRRLDNISTLFGRKRPSWQGVETV